MLKQGEHLYKLTGCTIQFSLCLVESQIAVSWPEETLATFALYSKRLVIIRVLRNHLYIRDQPSISMCNTVHIHIIVQIHTTDKSRFFGVLQYIFNFAAH